MPLVKQVPRTAEHENGVRDAVGDRVEEGAPDRGGARGLGDGPVEEVVHARDDQEDDGEVQMAGGHEDRGHRRGDQPGGGQDVSRDAMAVQ